MMQVWMVVFVFGLCHSFSQASQCITPGNRFPNDAISECRGYTTCVGIRDVMYQYDLTCPDTFIYNPVQNQCTNATNYQCFPEYNCTGNGIFENPTAKDCSSYVICFQGLNNTAVARRITCARNTVFSPIKGDCVNDIEYQCPQDTVVTDFPKVSTTFTLHNVATNTGNSMNTSLPEIVNNSVYSVNNALRHSSALRYSFIAFSFLNCILLSFVLV